MSNGLGGRARIDDSVYIRIRRDQLAIKGRTQRRDSYPTLLLYKV
jgi:hypothetical protein